MMTTSHQPKNSLAWRVLVSIFAFSSIITFIATGAQMYREFDFDRNIIVQRLNEIGDTQLGILEENLWRLDNVQVQTQLIGITRFPDIVFASVESRDQLVLSSEGEEIIAQAGAKTNSESLTRTFDIFTERRGYRELLAVLTVQATLANAVDRAWGRLTFILLTQALKTFLVATFAFLVFRSLISRHLNSLVRQLQHAPDSNNDVSQLDRPLVLDKDPPRKGRVPNELDILVESMNLERRRRKLEFDRRSDLEKELRKRNSELERANSAKDNFLMNMSHEFRTPMCAIRGFSELIVQDKDCGPQSREWAHLILKNCTHVEHIVDEILTLKKIEQGMVIVVDESVNLRPHIEALCESVRHSGPSAGITLSHHIAPDVPESVEIDPVRLDQILINLIANAYKFTPQGQVRLRVLLGTQQWEEGSDEPASQPILIFEVSDTGVGIPQEFHDRIFLPFEQGDNSITRHHGGTGIGLPLSRKLANLMKGSLELVSSSASGSLFRLTLPCQPTTSQTASDLPSQPLQPAPVFCRPPNFRGRKVLVVDDAPDIRLLLCHMVMETSALVQSTKNAQEGLKILRSEDIDLAIIDIQMPEMNGLQMMEQILKEELSVICISCSANVSRQDRFESLHAGFVEHIAKPIDRNALFATLEQYLSPSPTE